MATAEWSDMSRVHLKDYQLVCADRDKWRDIAGELAGVIKTLTDESCPWCAALWPKHSSSCNLAAALARFDAMRGE